MRNSASPPQCCYNQPSRNSGEIGGLFEQR